MCYESRMDRGEDFDASFGGWKKSGQGSVCFGLSGFL